MTSENLLDFREIWFVDFEFNITSENRQGPVCLVAYELRSERLVKVWQDELIKMKISDIDFSESTEKVDHDMAATVDGGVYNHQTRHIRKDGSIFPVWLISNIVRELFN